MDDVNVFLSKGKMAVPLKLYLAGWKLSREKMGYYEKLYSDLEKHLSWSNDEFKWALLLSYKESVYKMLKNKKRYLWRTCLCNLAEGVGSVGLALVFIIVLFLQEYKAVISYLNAVDLMEKFLKIFDSGKNGVVVAVIGNVFYGGLIFVVICLCIGLIAFVLRKLIALGLTYFKPKETWVRHSREVYQLSMEIIKYLDGSGEYKNLDAEETYDRLKSRVEVIWNENLDRFYVNMDKADEKRVSAYDRIARWVKS